ncbi:hypothetical protein LTR66_003013 [Elasticomyces elasticus]|nr:hypothetical protein LTR66_003013 [Elasticomyces elasticus]
MQDPSQGVPAALLPHVHLLSGHKYPILPSTTTEHIYECLNNAQRIVKQIAPMAWTYLQAPQDGTLQMEWLSPQMEAQGRWPTDGYIWADPESIYVQQVNGYQIEFLVHESGYRPGEAMCMHARRRYRLASKDPNVSGPEPDRNLWMVHYLRASPQHCFPSQHVQIPPQVTRAIQERRWLENQGRLERKDFMLHDRSNWPQLSMPSSGQSAGPYMAQQGYHSSNPMPPMGGHRYSASQFPQGYATGIGPSPAKRQRQMPPQQVAVANTHGVPSVTAAALLDTSIEDEENTAMGDTLDNLAPRDISVLRFTQHHEWMEEIFSSPYAVNEIQPVDLGFGFMGELSSLTRGLFDPSPNSPDRVGSKLSSTAMYQKVTREQLAEFRKRASAHSEREEAKLERMRKEHDVRMGQLRQRNRALLAAERRLRSSPWDDSDSGQEFWRLDVNVDHAKGHSSHNDLRSVNNIVQEVEQLLGVRVRSEKNALCVEKGGLVEEHIPLSLPVFAPTLETELNGLGQERVGQGLDSSSATKGYNVDLQSHERPYPEVSNSSTFHSTHAQVQPQRRNLDVHAYPSSSVPSTQPSQMTGIATRHHDTADIPQMDAFNDNDMSLMEDMDMDVEMSHVRTDHNDSDDGNNTNSPWAMVPPPTDGQRQQSSNVEGTTHTGGDPGVFDAADFASFDPTGDGLVDFDGGQGDLGLDLDNSAFGDAFHGTEAHEHLGEDSSAQ